MGRDNKYLHAKYKEQDLLPGDAVVARANTEASRGGNETKEGIVEMSVDTPQCDLEQPGCALTKFSTRVRVTAQAQACDSSPCRQAIRDVFISGIHAHGAAATYL